MPARCPPAFSFLRLFPLRTGVLLCMTIDLVTGLATLADILGLLPRQILSIPPPPLLETFCLFSCGVAAALGIQGVLEQRCKLVQTYHWARWGTMTILVYVSVQLVWAQCWYNPSVVYMFCLVRIAYEGLATYIAWSSCVLLSQGEIELFRIGPEAQSQLQAWRESGGVLLQKC